MRRIGCRRRIVVWDEQASGHPAPLEDLVIFPAPLFAGGKRHGRSGAKFHELTSTMFTRPVKLPAEAA